MPIAKGQFYVFTKKATANNWWYQIHCSELASTRLRENPVSNLEEDRKTLLIPSNRKAFWAITCQLPNNRRPAANASTSYYGTPFRKERWSEKDGQARVGASYQTGPGQNASPTSFAEALPKRAGH